MKEFGDEIEFHERLQKNASEVVFDTAAGGTYIEAALCSIGVSDQQLMKNVAEQIHKNVLETRTVQWPPFIHELEKKEKLDELLSQMITWMKCPEKISIDDSAIVRMIVSILTSYITGNCTTFQANMAVINHGLTKSREIVDIMHRDGLGVS